MRRGILALALGTLLASTAHAQARWVGSIQGGYSVSTSTAASFPAGGSFGSSAFIGRQVTPILAVGGEAGFYGVENTVTESRVECLPGSPLPSECIQTDQAELDWIQFGATMRLGKSAGTWRPYGAAGLAFYFGTRDTEVSSVDARTGTFYRFPEQESVTRTAFGGSLGGGLDWAPGRSSWSLGVSARLHYLVGGDENGEFGGDTFVTLLAGVGYRW